MITLNDCVNNFLIAHVGEIAPATLQWYTSHLTALCHTTLGSHDITTITLTDLRRWRADLIQHQTRYDDHPLRPQVNGRGLSVHTIRGKIRAVKIFFTWMVEEGVLNASPADRLKPPRAPRNEVPKAIPDDDVRKMRAYAVEHDMPREIALIHLLAETGARVRGIANLTRADVDLTTGCVIVTEKGEKTRPVYLTPLGVDALRAWLRARPLVDHDYLLTSYRGGRLTESGIYQTLKRLARKTGVRRFNPHSFRHAFAREMLNAGLSLASVAGLMGHSSVSVTAESYAVWTQQELHAKAVAAARKRALWQEKP